MGANNTAEAFQTLDSELDSIWRIVNDNRAACEALPAVQGGVCMIIGERHCSYLSSESEGTANLTRAN